MICLAVLLCAAAGVWAQQRVAGYPVSGRVIDRLTREPVPYAAVVVAGQEQHGASTDSLGRFRIERVQPGISRLQVSSVGYRTTFTPEYLVSASTPFIEIEVDEDATQLEAVTVRPTPFRTSVEVPVGMQVIGVREIEKSPGANRDVSRIVRSYPGVAFSPVGYRNDLIVRGGGPSENKFYMDGIEIPNINHFATQGATGGPVSIVNADLVREINFYTGAFPADRSGALSSVLDFSLRDGDPVKQNFKATLGASEVGVSGNGHIGRRTTYLFSLRQSYLQLLFKMLGLPFLPNYIDGQVKVKTRLSEHDEVTFHALAGFDNMRLNVDEEGEEAEYLLSYLPRIRQETFTVGASWRHYAGRHVQTLSLSHNYLNNRNLKYRNNDSSTEENLILRLRGVEQKSALRFENRTYAGRWTLREGAELTWTHYANDTRQRLYTDEALLTEYSTRLGIVGWGLFAGADYASADKRLTASAGLRADGCDYSARMAQPWHQLSPRASVRYSFDESWSVSGSAGLYWQLPPLTALGFKQEGRLVNESLGYLHVWQFGAGGEWRLRDRLAVSVTGFYKLYGDVPTSVADGIPLLCKGNDYGVVGNELLVPTAEGRAYGVEALARWQVPGRLNVVLSTTRGGIGDALPQRVPRRPLGAVPPLGVGQPLRRERQRHLGSAPQLERRHAVERRGRLALHALRRGEVVACRGVGCAGTPLLRLYAVQCPAARRLCAARRAGRQDLLFPAVHARLLHRPAECHREQAPPAGCPHVNGRRREPRSTPCRAALPHEAHRAGERHAAAHARHHGGVLTGGRTEGPPPGEPARELVRKNWPGWPGDMLWRFRFEIPVRDSGPGGAFGL